MKYHVDWLKSKCDQGLEPKFLFFWGHTPAPNETVGAFLLSQWYPASFEVEGILYPTSEHFMMAHKALLFGDQVVFEQIIHSKTPGEAKDLGRMVSGFVEDVWVSTRYEIVKKANLEKFGQNEILKNYLVQTDQRILVEASPVDRIWGIGLTKDDPNASNIHAWRGTNLLGFALMEVRDSFNRQTTTGKE
ncbi:MAG: NADAR family protein [Saprospiraceae bacterium]|nr:NADAR family protein [Saprospiraceae bacterium]